MLQRRHGKQAMRSYDQRNESIRHTAAEYDARMTGGEVAPIYQFGEGVLKGEDLTFSDEGISVPGFARDISLKIANPFQDMTPE